MRYFCLGFREPAEEAEEIAPSITFFNPFDYQRGRADLRFDPRRRTDP